MQALSQLSYTPEICRALDYSEELSSFSLQIQFINYALTPH